MADLIACATHCRGLSCDCIQQAWRRLCEQNTELWTRVRRAEAADEQRLFEVNALRAELIRLREEMRLNRHSEDFSILPIDG